VTIEFSISFLIQIYKKQKECITLFIIKIC